MARSGCGSPSRGTPRPSWPRDLSPGCVIAEDDAGPCGYALYSVRPTWGDDGIPDGVLQIRELMATDPAAHAAIWNDLLSRDPPRFGAGGRAAALPARRPAPGPPTAVRRALGPAGQRAAGARGPAVL